MKKLVVVLFLILGLVVVLALRSDNQKQIASKSVPVLTVSSPSDAAQIHLHEYAAKGRVPAYYKTMPDMAKLRPTLSPDLFTGNKRLAYQAAKEIPQVLAQLPCYCHCDRGHGHTSLHSCFEDEHGEYCGICIGEAVMAHTLHRRGVNAAEIRKQIIAAYGQPDTE